MIEPWLAALIIFTAITAVVGVIVSELRKSWVPLAIAANIAIVTDIVVTVAFD